MSGRQLRMILESLRMKADARTMKRQDVGIVLQPVTSRTWPISSTAS